MEQHPIPQQISSYQFRLVGDMTLKQFFQLAGGLLGALIFYSSPLIGIVKWPLTIISALLGAALAFLPLEERPLEKWLIAFFRAIYSPTIYDWKRSNDLNYFLPEENSDPNVLANQQQSLDKVLAPQGGLNSPLEKLEQAEKGFLSNLTNLFTGNVSQPTTTPQITPTVNIPTQVAVQPASGSLKPNVAIPIPQPASNQGVQIPVSNPIKITKQDIQKVVTQEINGPQITTTRVEPIIVGNEMVSTKQAFFSVDAAPPNPPTTPNVVVGQVVDSDKRIVEGAIMEIRDSMGMPIRAIKSNRLGHFITVTSLESGRYEILTEKEGYEFTPVTFQAQGTIIPPILVSGTKKVIPENTASSNAQALGQNMNDPLVNQNQFKTI